MSLAEAKAALRSDLYARRNAPHAARAEKDPTANARLLARLAEEPARVVSGFLPIRTEIDPRPTMAALDAEDRRICVPVVEAKGAPLRFREWRPGAPLVPGPFGAMVPAEGDWLEPEALICPLIGWDRAGWRLGYGGGFYDRTLERLRALRPTLAIGFAYAAQELDAAPREPTDQRLDAMVTEEETIEFD